MPAVQQGLLGGCACGTDLLQCGVAEQHSDLASPFFDQVTKQSFEGQRCQSTLPSLSLLVLSGISSFRQARCFLWVKDRSLTRELKIVGKLAEHLNVTLCSVENVSQGRFSRCLVPNKMEARGFADVEVLFSYPLLRVFLLPCGHRNCFILIFWFWVVVGENVSTIHLFLAFCRGQ